MDGEAWSGAAGAEMVAGDALRRLVSAVLLRAVEDARANDASAVAWLASRDAEKWFDFLDLPQSTVLKRSGWMDWASHVTANQTLPADQLECISTTYEYLLELR